MATAHISRDDLEDQTRGVECRKDSGVIDEMPSTNTASGSTCTPKARLARMAIFWAVGRVIGFNRILGGR